MSARRFSPLDNIIMNIDQGVRTVFGKPDVTERANPADKSPENEMSEANKKLSIGLMRVNHSGEVAAQALYQGQALTARDSATKEQMQRSAQEEFDHLDWCEKRVKELGGHTSYLNPLWYAGSLTIGAMAGAIGDKWSLGFVVETEKQVGKHLEEHLGLLPGNDDKSRAVLKQMDIDEAEHAVKAQKAGAAELPPPIKTLMKLTSKAMTKTAYRI
ncbi:MAG: 2-polyprenyl-3-methyl-6-methoxy-1,4-benzoquinone monooxygenase [Gammaproteobacteria bacterium]|nr:2-polyprenyl-3-methyl-6-methoxy-1,4-benzoquinone monooxygenase [Gammaproteobacteria bacterium]